MESRNTGKTIKSTLIMFDALLVCMAMKESGLPKGGSCPGENLVGPLEVVVVQLQTFVGALEVVVVLVKTLFPSRTGVPVVKEVSILI